MGSESSSTDDTSLASLKLATSFCVGLASGALVLFSVVFWRDSPSERHAKLAFEVTRLRAELTAALVDAAAQKRTNDSLRERLPEIKSPPAGVPATVEFDGVLWKWNHEIKSINIHNNRVFSGHQYSSPANPDFRLIDVSCDKTLLARVRRVEVSHPVGKWMRHGAEEVFLNDGGRELARYENDVRIGHLQAWYANGQLRLEEYFDRTGRTGPSRGWDEKGKLQWDVVYENDQEIKVNFPVSRAR